MSIRPGLKFYGGSTSPSPDLPHKYGRYYFPDKESLKQFRDWYQLREATRRAGFPTTPQGMSAFKAIRDELAETAKAKRTEMNVRRKIRAEHGLAPTGRLPVKVLKDLQGRRRVAARK